MRESRKHRPDTPDHGTGQWTGTRRRYRSTSLASLLARLGSRPGQQVWSVRCRDERGQRARLLIGLARSGITITATAFGPCQLTVLELDRLRDVLRDVVLVLGLAADLEPINAGRRIAPRRIVIRERPGGQGSSPELALPTGQPHPRRQSALPVTQLASGN